MGLTTHRELGEEQLVAFALNRSLLRVMLPLHRRAELHSQHSQCLHREQEVGLGHVEGRGIAETVLRRLDHR